MIRVSLSDHWRIRRSEWMLSLCTLTLGLVYLANPGLMTPAYFGPLLALMRQAEWGSLILAVGIGRITMLMINGAWRASPHLRVLGAWASCALWLTLFVTAVGAEATVQAVAFWPVFFLFDALSAIDAAGDARLADERARSMRLASDVRNGG